MRTFRIKSPTEKDVFINFDKNPNDEQGLEWSAKCFCPDTDIEITIRSPSRKEVFFWIRKTLNMNMMENPIFKGKKLPGCERFTSYA